MTCNSYHLEEFVRMLQSVPGFLFTSRWFSGWDFPGWRQAGARLVPGAQTHDDDAGRQTNPPATKEVMYPLVMTSTSLLKIAIYR